MLLKLSNFIEPNNHLAKRKFKGVVVDNDDPLKLGRVCCTIAGLVEETTVSKLPWIAPDPLFGGAGGSGGEGGFFVPILASELVIEFPFDDIYSPFFTGFWQSSATHQGIFDEDYPNIYGFTDEQTTRWSVNRAKKEAEFHHTSGSVVKFDSDGTITITSKKSINFESEDGRTTFVHDLNAGEITQTPKEELQFAGNRTKITSKEQVSEVGTITNIVTGSKTEEISGGFKQLVGGSYGRGVTGNEAVSIAGSQSLLVANAVDQVVGTDWSVTMGLGGAVIANLLGSIELSIGGGITLAGPVEEAISILQEMTNLIATATFAGFGAPISNLAAWVTLNTRLLAWIALQ